jgi:hypothetical protein
MHIIAACDKDALPIGRRCMSKEGDDAFDGLYTERRFVALTGIHTKGDTCLDMTDTLVTFVAERLTGPDERGRVVDWTSEPLEGEGLSDTEVIERALKARSSAGAFGHSILFKDLWEGNEDALAEHFPDEKGKRVYDASRADAALAQHLAFWCAGNCEQIERIMRMSPGLAREKWDAREDYYLPLTITRAVNRQKQFYNPKALRLVSDDDDRDMPPPPPPGPVGSRGEKITTLRKAKLIEGSRLMTAEEQVKYFDGCVYVRSVHRVLLPDGNLVDPVVFRAFYGGYKFQFQVEGKPETDAFNTFTQSQLVEFPKVAEMCFRPDLPSRCLVDGAVNTYIDPGIEGKEGDVSLFTDHIAKLLPDPNDQRILLDYGAACVQFPGSKFQWAPVIQGCEGNGKSLIATVLRNCIGIRYFHSQDPEDMANTFNAWIERSIVACVEEIFVNYRYEMSNRMKAMITNSYGPLHAKSKDQRSGFNCCKFIFFSNHRDGVLKYEDDRRYAVFFTAQQKRRDMERDGMDAAYFHRLIDFIESAEGRAILVHYFRNRKIETDMMSGAPMTTSTEEAVYESLSAEERTLLDSIDEEAPGFRNGIIAGPYVDNVLVNAGYKKPHPKKRAKMIDNIGYESPRKVAQGRIRMGDRMLKIYVRKNSPLIHEAAEVLRKVYQTANSETAVS